MATREIVAKAADTTIVRFNKEQGGIEVIFPKSRRLTTAEQAWLNSWGRWHRRNGYYYIAYSPEKMEELKQSFVAKEAKIPGGKAEEAVAAVAADKAAKKAAKPKAEKKPSAQAARLDALETSMAQMMQMMQMMMAAQNTTK